MVIVLFRSKLMSTVGKEYLDMAGELLHRAKSMPGFIDFKTFEASDGEHVAVIHWESEELLRAWSDDLRHSVAQRLGRDQWYESFRVEIATVTRSYGFDRPTAAPAS